MDKVRYGIIGTAGIAKKSTLPGMVKASNSIAYAIAGRNADKVKQYQQEFGIEKGYTSYDAILDDPNVDAVYIPLSNQLHVQWCVKAAQKKKHILCEKPLAPSEKELREVFRIAEENGVKTMEAFPYVHSPLMCRIKEIVASGEIGKILNVSAAFIVPRHPITNVRMRRETLGGSIYDLGCYNTSLALEIFESEPEAVTASATFTGEHIDDTATIIMDFGGGRRAVSISEMVLTAGHRRMPYTIYGEKGYVEVTENGYNISGIRTLHVNVEGCERIERIDCPDNYMLEVEQFSRCILDGEPYRFTHEQSLANARILDRAFAAIGY